MVALIFASFTSTVPGTPTKDVIHANLRGPGKYTATLSSALDMEAANVHIYNYLLPICLILTVVKLFSIYCILSSKWGCHSTCVLSGILVFLRHVIV